MPEVPEHVLKVKEMLEKSLGFDDPNKAIETGYWGVGIGMDGNEPVIVVYYDESIKKRDVQLLGAYEYGGKVVRVKVIKAKIPSALPYYRPSIWRRIKQKLRRFFGPKQTSCFTSKVRPLEAGTSVCDCALTACSSTGPFIDLDTGQVAWVTAAHCTKWIATCQDGSNVIGRPFCQPGPYDGGTYPSDWIGNSYKATPNFWQSVPISTDTIAIKLNEGVQVSTYICGTKEYFGKPIYLNGKYRTPNPGEQICKSGRTTYVQCGTVQSVHTTVIVNYNCFIRNVNDVIITTPILQPGDSGSVGFATDGTFLGLGFAGSDELSAFIDPNEIANTLHLVPYGGAPPSPTPTPTPTPSPSPTPTPTPTPTPPPPPAPPPSPPPTPPPTPTPSPSPPPVPPWQIVCQIGCAMCNYVNQQCDCNKYIEVTKVGDGKYEVIIKTTTDSQCVAGCLGCTILNLVCCGS